MSLQDAINEIRTKVLTVSDIQDVPEYAPEQLNAFPIVVVYPFEGEWKSNDSTFKTSLHTIIVELHVQRNDLPNAVQSAMAFSDSIPIALIDGLGTYTYIRTWESIRYRAGPMKWAEIDTWGFRWFIADVKLQSTS